MRLAQPLKRLRKPARQLLSAPRRSLKSNRGKTPPNGKLSLKYGNLVMPLIKAVQELSARVKTLEG